MVDRLKEVLEGGSVLFDPQQRVETLGAPSAFRKCRGHFTLRRSNHILEQIMQRDIRAQAQMIAEPRLDVRLARNKGLAQFWIRHRPFDRRPAAPESAR